MITVFSKRYAMQVLMYAQDGVGTNIRESIRQIAPGMELFTTTADLSSRFRHPLGEAAIAVLVVKTREDLASLQRMRHLLQDVRTILILPDRGAETVATGHNLQPRFLGCLDDDAEEIASVLKKMLTVSRLPDGR